MSPRLDRLLLITALLASAAYGVADENPALLLVGLVGVLCSWSVIRARGGQALPLSATIALTLAAVGYAMIRLVGEGFKVSVFSEFVLALLIVKLVDRRSARDNAQVLLLSVFLVVGAILTSNRLLLGLLILAFVPVFAATVVRHQIETAREAASTLGVAEPARRSPVERLDFRRLVWVCTLACLVISVGVFVLMPRGVGMQAFGSWGNTSLGAVTSFTDEVELGRGGLISQSSTPVLDLEVRDASGKIRGSASEVFYLRGAVLDLYEEGAWRRDRNRQSTFISDQGVPLYADGTAYKVGSETTTDTELRITMRNMPRGEAHLFSVWRPVEFETLSQMHMKHDMGDGTMIRIGQPGKYEYVVRCRQSNEPGARARSSRRETVSFPSASIKDLATRLLVEAENPIDPDPATRPVEHNSSAVRKFKIYLAANYSYSLETRSAPPGEDPIEWFLFGEDRRGHCEYFAAAMAAMCRSVGIDARVITGYVATEWNAPTGHYIVRESNAHAWVEVEVIPGIWKSEDPTPVGDLDSIHRPSTSVLARLRRLLDTAEYAWINSVVGFNRRSRSKVVESTIDDTMTTWTQELGERVRTGGAGLLMRAFGAGMVAFAFSMAIGLFGLWLVRGPWRGGAERLRRRLSAMLARVLPRRAAHTHEVLRADLLRAFERLGRPIPRWRPIRAHADAVRSGGALPEDADAALEQTVWAIYRGRYGAEPIDRGDASAIRSALTRATRGRRPKRSDAS